ncbi:MAG: radical SAM protein [Nitrospirota bacterium]
MILVHPPVAKPSEPPAGIAKLSGTLSSHGINHTVLDANLEALLYIIGNTHLEGNTKYGKWTERAIRNITGNHLSIKALHVYQNIDRYKRAVTDLNHAVGQWEKNRGFPGIANYRHKDLSPLRSDDLLQAAECPEENPYYPYFSRRLISLIEESPFRIVGFSLNYLSQALCTFAMIGCIKKYFPEISFVLGGGLVTSWLKNPDWQNPFKGFVDHLIAGPGESALLDILGADNIQKERSCPDYALLPFDDYLAPGRILPYSASSGCYWNKCSFCPERSENNPYIPVPADRALNELGRLIMQTGPSLVHLLDNAVSTPLLRSMAEKHRAVPWYGFARISDLLTDIDFCRALKKSGCVMLKMGLESGDQDVLDKMHKGIDIATASRALKTLKEAGIATYVYLILGTPAETLQAARKTLEFVVAHKDEIGFLNAAIFNMPVCGPEVSRVETRSFYECDLSLYTDFLHPQGWDRKEVRLFLDNEFKRHRVVSGILKQDPPIFTSNHAPFFAMRTAG